MASAGQFHNTILFKDRKRAETTVHQLIQQRDGENQHVHLTQVDFSASLQSIWLLTRGKGKMVQLKKTLDNGALED